MRKETFDYSVDLSQSILWQYNNSANLISLVDYKQDWYDVNQTAFWEYYYNQIFNLINAEQFGLVVWAIILDIPLYYNPGQADDWLTFGFNQYDPTFPTLLNTYKNFSFGDFNPLGSAISLPVEYQRLLLRLRYYQLVSRGAINEINEFLNALFPTAGTPFNGMAWVLDGLDMTMTYVFDFYMPKLMRKILVQLDLLPRPAGVELKYISQPNSYFGFGSSNKNFNNGGFYKNF